jgi:hypothetical protein
MACGHPRLNPGRESPVVATIGDGTHSEIPAATGHQQVNGQVIEQAQAASLGRLIDDRSLAEPQLAKQNGMTTC